MATIQITANFPIDCSHVPGINQRLFSGYNVGLPEESYEVIKTHPYLSLLLKDGTIRFYKRDAKAEGELLGVPVKEDKRTDEPTPVVTPEVRKGTQKYTAPKKEVEQQTKITGTLDD